MFLNANVLKIGNWNWITNTNHPWVSEKFEGYLHKIHLEDGEDEEEVEKYVRLHVSIEYLFQKSTEPKSEYFEHIIMNILLNHSTDTYYIGKGE